MDSFPHPKPGLKAAWDLDACTCTCAQVPCQAGSMCPCCRRLSLGLVVQRASLWSSVHMQTRAQTAGSAQSCRAWLLWPDLPASGEFHPGMGVDVLHGSSQALATQTRRTTHARASRDALGKTRSWNLEGLTGLSMTWLSAHSHSGRDPTPEASHSQPSCFVLQSLPHTSATVPSRPVAKPSILHQPHHLQARHAEHEPELAKRTEHLLQEHKGNHARRAGSCCRPQR